MKEYMDGKAPSWCISMALRVVIISMLLPLTAQAGPGSPACNALVSIANDLYLVGPNGNSLVQFTSDGIPKNYATLSPDGTKVAYVTPDVNGDADTYSVVDVNGRQQEFPLFGSRAAERSTGTQDLYATQPLMGLIWNSNNILRLKKHVGPTEARFEFHQIGDDLTGLPQMLGEPRYGISCASDNNGGQIACLQDGELTVGDREVYYESNFLGTAPLASFTLTKGVSTTTPGTPSFTLEVISFSKDTVGPQITLPNGNWERPYLSNDGNDFAKIWWRGQSYGFSITIIDAKTGLVRIDEVKGGTRAEAFDPALAWQPRGPGLFLIRRTKTHAELYLIQPHGKGSQWQLVANRRFDVPEIVAMRFAAPSVLLLEGESHQFREVAVRIRKRSSERGGLSLTLGAVKSLPTTMAVTTNGKSTQGTVLDWSCKASHSDDED